MAGIRPATVVPMAVFAVTLGLAWWMSSGADASPTTTLHRAVTAYHRALQEGDLAEAARFVPEEASGERRELEERSLAWRRARDWGLPSLEVADGGASATVTVQRLDASGVVVEETESWKRAEGGAWGLVGWEETGRGPSR